MPVYPAAQPPFAVSNLMLAQIAYHLSRTRIGPDSPPLRDPVSAAAPYLPEAERQPLHWNYWWYCAQCHGTDLQGRGINQTSAINKVPTNFGTCDVRGRTRQQVIDGIASGGRAVRDEEGGSLLTEKMPPWQGRLSAEEIAALADYILEFARSVPESSGGDQGSRNNIRIEDR